MTEVLALAALLGLLPGPALAAAPAAKPPAVKPLILPGQEVELKTEDGWTLAGKYLPSSSAPQTLILLHGKGERKELWIKLAKALAKAGYGYFGLDLRGHGQSGVGPDGQPAPWRKFKSTKSENGYEGMTRDIAAAVSWLAAQGVPEESIGLIGTYVGGSVGLKYAAVHPKVPVIVLLSPGTHYEEVLTVNAIRAYKNRPILMIYSEADRFSSRDAPVLYQFARMAAGDRNAWLVSVPFIPGSRLPQSTGVIRQTVAWLVNPVKPDIPAGSSVPIDGQPLSAGGPDDLLTPDEAPPPLPPDPPSGQRQYP